MCARGLCVCVCVYLTHDDALALLFTQHELLSLARSLAHYCACLCWDEAGVGKEAGAAVHIIIIIITRAPYTHTHTGTRTR